MDIMKTQMVEQQAQIETMATQIDELKELIKKC